MLQGFLSQLARLRQHLRIPPRATENLHDACAQTLLLVLFTRPGLPTQILCRRRQQATHPCLKGFAIDISHQIPGDIFNLVGQQSQYCTVPVRLQPFGKREIIPDFLPSHAYRGPDISQQHDAFGGSHIAFHVASHRAQVGNVKFSSLFVRTTHFVWLLPPRSAVASFMHTGTCHSSSLFLLLNIARSKEYRCCESVAVAEFPAHCSSRLTMGAPGCFTNVGIIWSTGFFETAASVLQK